MKRSIKTVSVVLIGSMLMSLSACQDNNTDEVSDLADDVAKYTVNRYYNKLSALTENGDDKLKEIFREVGDDGFREVIASTLTYEIVEDSLEKDGSDGYTIDVTFTYVDYEEVLEDGSIVTVDEFESAVADCDKVIEETITLEFEEDGSDLLFVNIEDLEVLFPYWDEDLSPVAGVEVSEETEETEDPTPEANGLTVEPVEPTFDDLDQTGNADWTDTQYPDPADYLVEGESYLLPHTNILFTVPSDTDFDDEWSYDGFSDFHTLDLSGYWGRTYMDYYIVVYGGNESCFSQNAYTYRDESVQTESENVRGYASHEVSQYDITIGDVTYEGMLSTVTRRNGETHYIYVVCIGNNNIRYNVIIESGDINNIYNFAENFSVV